MGPPKGTWLDPVTQASQTNSVQTELNPVLVTLTSDILWGSLINKMPSDSVSRIDPGLASYQQNVYSTVMPDAKFYCEGINVFEIK